MIIQHNMLAMNNLYMGKQIQKGKAKNLERLASGYRINRAADDAANMAISEKMQSRIRALARCQNNIEEGISLTQTADGALNEVNDMLNRVNELCVQAANGTNTSDDRSKIAEEITQIYDDMDRIFEDTEFNTMKIFRHAGDNFYGPDPEYEYHEAVTVKLPDGELSNWGAGMFPTKQFDKAQPAKKATATLTFTNDVNLSDMTSLDGTSFFLKRNGSSYKIEFGTAKQTGLTNNNYYININDSRCNTVQKAFNKLSSDYPFYQFIDSVSVSGNQVKFTFTMPEETKQITFKADTNQDGIRETITANETVTNGAKNNGISIYCEGNILNPIGSPDNTLKFHESATVELKILDGVTTLPPASFNGDLAAYLQNLSYNELRLFSYSDTLDLSSLPMSNIQTADDLRRELATAINTNSNTKNNFSATYDNNQDTITITAKGLSTTTNSYGYVDEEPGTSPNKLEKDTTSISVSIQSSTPTSEAKTTHTFTLPELNSSNIYTVKIDNTNYMIYDTATYPNYTVSDSDPSKYYSIYGTYSWRDMEETFVSILRSNYPDYNVELDSATNKVTMTSKELNDTTTIQVESTDPSVKAILEPNAQEGLGITTYPAYYTKEYDITLDFSSALNNGAIDTSTLNGKGFMLNNTYYQFRDNNNTYEKYNAGTKWIEINGITAIDDLGNAIKDAINNSTLTATTNGLDKLTLSGKVKTNNSDNSTINFSDGGPTGIFATSAVSSGGAAQKNPQTEIDFSKYDMGNLDELYGTGFRLTCATCPGEFINIVFCHDKSELDYPDSFPFTDDKGNTNTIHNYMVELKDVTHGSQIAANIAEQLQGDLDHFTEVKVSDTNPSVLIAQDKRSKDQTGRGQIMAGVYTNFIYHVTPEKLPNPDDKVGGGRKDTDAYYAYCMIYAGDTREKPYIPVHLPHFSVENLKLEYPKEPWDTYDKITDVMNRSKNAAEVVSMARSKIGADQNRLEHAFDYAANAEEQITAANSRIKDTDMADAVTTNAKLTILSNAQEAMLSQIMDLPERILPLLQ